MLAHAADGGDVCIKRSEYFRIKLRTEILIALKMEENVFNDLKWEFIGGGSHFAKLSEVKLWEWRGY